MNPNRQVIYNQLQEEIDSVYKLSKSTSQIGYYLPNKTNKMGMLQLSAIK